MPLREYGPAADRSGTPPTIDQLIVYEGFERAGHWPSKPKSSRAVMQHDLEWFDAYIFAPDAPAASTRRR